MNCPVCGTDMNTLRCSCGYDASRDYERRPTFGPVAPVPSVSGLRQRRAPKDALRCKKCGGAAFLISVPDGTRRCQSCGWSPDEAPLLVCDCGSRCFTARLEDGALMCPLCSRELPLDQFLARVRNKSGQKPTKIVSAVIEPAPAAPASAAADHAPMPKKAVQRSEPMPVSTPRPADIQPPSSLRDRYGKPALPTITAIAAGVDHTVALYSDGTVGAVGSRSFHKCAVGGWTGITAIAAGHDHTVGLKQNGTVVACGRNDQHQCDVGSWTEVTAIAAGEYFTVGLRRDGTLLIAGTNYGSLQVLKPVKNITAVAAGTDFIVALDWKNQVRTNRLSAFYQNHWRDITAIAAGNGPIAGLRADGTVIAEIPYDNSLRDAANWRDITAIASNSRYVLGLRKDGTVAAAGDNHAGQCNVQDWTGIVAIAAGWYHCVGLREDGILVAAGSNNFSQCDVYKLIKR